MKRSVKRSDWPCRDVHWYAGKRKKPIAYSSKADSDTVNEINWPNKTPRQLMDQFDRGAWIRQPDIIRVLQAYIDLGHGDEILRTRDPSL